MSGFRVAAPPRLAQRRKVALIGDLNLPQCRKYRVEQLAEIFHEAGAEYIFAHYEDLPRCMDILQDATHLLLYRLRGSPIVTRHLYEARRLRLPVLYDIDDPLFSIPAYAGYGNMAALPGDMLQGFLAEAPFYAEMMNIADAVSVSTPALQEHARDFTCRPVFLRRNFADLATLGAPQPNGPRAGDAFRVCFASGSRGHEIDFAEVSRDLARFLAGDSRRRLVILGHFDRKHLPQALRQQVECHPFTGYAAYLTHLSGCDVAVMPLADDLFNRCKSGVRVIDAASVGVPAIVGKVSDMQAVVENGVTGRVLGPGRDWASALEDLARDPALCRDMGNRARQTLEQRWSARLDLPVVDPEMLRWIAA
ncbi:glycosyltransferase [Oceanicola sp. S124]|uniref:glycosyltransferase n=1 Tax=Oceanicola sp. S124 TaxID=1042378 RepID=UPI00143A89EB|nr:glycosyltransferase [Oceanicola sp. S124]